jgi:hypothetical protein
VTNLIDAVEGSLYPPATAAEDDGQPRIDHSLEAV